MFTIINYFIFIVLCILSLKYIFSSTQLMKDPLIKKNKIPVTGTQYFFLFLLSVGILSLGSLMANRLLLSIIFCIIAFFYDKNKPVFTITTFAYILYLLWLLFAIYYSPVRDYGFRVFLKYIYPFLVMLLAAKVSTSISVMDKSMKNIFNVGLVGVLFILVLSRIPFISTLSWNIFWWPPAILDFFSVPIVIAFAQYAIMKKKKYLWIMLLFVIPSILTTNRTGLMGVSIAILLFALIHYKLKALPYLMLGLVIFFGTILYVPAFREKMFKKKLTTEEIIENRETLTSDDIDSSGRFAMWEWSLDHYYKDKELTGSGLGVLQEAFYLLRHPFGGIRICHNDYVQILCDTGLIGLFLYAFIFLSLVIHSIIIYWNKQNPFPVRYTAIIAACSLGGMAATLYTDNAVNYSLMTLSYPFAIYGITVGLKKRLKT